MHSFANGLDDARGLNASEESMVVVRLKDLCPLLNHAAKQGRAFLEDLADDPIHLTRDLFEVLIAYQRCAMDEAA